MTPKSPDILIRALEPGDLPDLTEAWNQPLAYAGTLQLPFTSLEAREKRHADKRRGGDQARDTIDVTCVPAIGESREQRHREQVATKEHAGYQPRFGIRHPPGGLELRQQRRKARKARQAEHLRDSHP